MIAIVPVLLPVGLMEQRKIAVVVLLLLIIVEVQLHVAIHRVSLHPLVRVVTQVVEVPVPVPVRQVEVVVEEDKMIGFIKKTYL